MFCSCGLLGSFLFARHVISSYNVLSERTMFNINLKDGHFLSLSNFNARLGCFVDTISTSRLTIFNRNFSLRKNTSNTDERITTEKKNDTRKREK